VSRRASLPGADELFRRTTERPEAQQSPEKPQVAKSTKLQVAVAPEEAAPEPKSKAPKHDEKITFYCTSDDLMALESTRLALRSKHGVSADRGKIVRAAVAYVLEDFDARGEDSILLHRLSE
jgi:hypothetical protein